MLPTNRPGEWGAAPVPAWSCERCGAQNGTWDASGALVHVYRLRLQPGAPLLDLCGRCRRAARRTSHSPA